MKRKRNNRRDKRQQRMLYFAYGSNMHVEQMAHRSPTAEPLGTAHLFGWRLVFRGVADIVAAGKRTKVPGVLWSITPADLRALDRYEGYPHLYTRFTVDVETDHGPAQAWVYVMTSDDTLGLPSKPYLRTCLQGLSAWGLPHWHLRRALKDAATALLDEGYDRDDLVRVGKRYLPKDRLPEPAPARAAVRRYGYSRTAGEYVPIDQVMSMSPATRRAWGLERAYDRERERIEGARAVYGD